MGEKPKITVNSYDPTTGQLKLTTNEAMDNILETEANKQGISKDEVMKQFVSKSIDNMAKKMGL